jgi:TrmH family RNA methyltransferase
MLSKAKLKYIKSLQLKKYRMEEQSFIVEGAKGVAELLDSEFQITMIAATPEFSRATAEALARLAKKGVEIIPATEKELAAAGSLQSNQSAIAVVKMKPNVAPRLSGTEYALVLDDIRDPGNLGTIIRTADWYGIHNIIASEETADLYNPKTISATMGSLLRVHMFYTILTEYLHNASNLYGTFLKGSDVHTIRFAKGGFIVIGNESNGISTAVAGLIHERIMIPRYGDAESLNAGVAAAIVLDNLRRSNK